MKLKVGDRINVYGIYVGKDGVLFHRNFKGPTKGVAVEVSDHYVDFQTSDGCTFCCHIKQVRKIKGRKRIWVNEYDSDLKYCGHDTKDEADREAGFKRIRCLEFIEVRKK